MSKTKSKILLALFLILVTITSCCFATSESATNDAVVTSEENTTTTSEEELSWTNSDLYIFQDEVTVTNVVDGNAFVMGETVTISGEIGGDLFVIADKLNIEGGYIYSSIFACANEITVNGVVYDVYAICDTFNLESNGFIYRDLKTSASTVNINGAVRRDAYISAGNINFGENAETFIYGNLNYSSDSEITIPEGAVTGEVKYTATNSIENNNNVGETIVSYITDLATTLISTLVITLILLWLTPKFIERVSNIKVSKSFAALGIGFAMPIAVILVSFLLIFSVLGLSVFAYLILAFTLLACMGFSITSILFGKLFTKLLKMEGNVKFVIFTLVSSVILWAICLIPVVGGILSVIISLYGIGLTVFNMIPKKEKIKNVENEVKE